MANHLDPTFVRAQIENLRHTHPDIWDEGDETLLADMLEAETGLNEFLTAVVRRMLQAETFAEANDAYIADAKAQRDKFKQRENAMRALAFKLLQAAELKKLELAPATLSIRAGQPKVIVTDETALLDKYVRIVRNPNHTEIKEAIARGTMVLGAEMSNAEPTLAVIRKRVK